MKQNTISDMRTSKPGVQTGSDLNVLSTDVIDLTIVYSNSVFDVESGFTHHSFRPFDELTSDNTRARSFTNSISGDTMLSGPKRAASPFALQSPGGQENVKWSEAGQDYLKYDLTTYFSFLATNMPHRPIQASGMDDKADRTIPSSFAFARFKHRETATTNDNTFDPFISPARKTSTLGETLPPVARKIKAPRLRYADAPPSFDPWTRSNDIKISSMPLSQALQSRIP